MNEDEILVKLKEEGRSLDALTQVDLSEFDQHHHGGLEAVNALAKAAGIASHHRVLDVCSEMGGPALWLAAARHDDCQFGEVRYAEYDSAHAHHVGLFGQGKLGGLRIAARRAELPRSG